jgi:hypothetical protein
MSEQAIEREIEMDHNAMPVIPVRAKGQDNSGGHQGIHASFLLGASNPVVQILPRDYDRLEARVMSTGASPQAIVLAQSKEIAENAAGQGAAFAGPAGSYLPASVDRVLRNCDETWAAWLGTSTALVSVVISRRLPDEPHPGA